MWIEILSQISELPVANFRTGTLETKTQQQTDVFGLKFIAIMSLSFMDTQWML